MNLSDYEKDLLHIVNHLIGYLIKNGCSEHDAQDIAQDTIVKILEIDDVLPAEKIRPWIFRVGTNLYFNLYNRKKRYHDILSVYFSSPDFEELTPDYSLLYEGMKQLTEKETTLLLLKYEERLSLKEIAFILNRPQESLKTELYRSRKKLQKIMEMEERKDDNDR